MSYGWDRINSGELALRYSRWCPTFPCFSRLRRVAFFTNTEAQFPYPVQAAMISLSRARANRGAAGAFCMLLAVAGIAPTHTRAGCGHDVSSTMSRSTSRYLSGLESSGFSGVERAGSTPFDTRRGLPCSGPSCSRGRALPHMPAPNSSVRIDLWCHATCPPRWKAPEPASTLDRSTTLRPWHNTSRVERPPRDPDPRALA